TFSEAVSGFDLADLQLALNGGSNLLTPAQTLTTSDSTTWTVGNLSGLTGTAGSYVLTLTAAGSGISDTAGNALAGDASSSFTVQPGAGSSLRVAGFPSPVQAGVAASFTVTALDAYGNIATGYSSTIGIGSSDSKGTLPANYTFTAS